MFRRLGGVLLGLCGMLLALEIALQLLPVSTATARNYYIDPTILSYPAGHRWQVSTGWDLRNPQSMRANNLGFASDIDFVPQPQAVALIGDSYVEASMLDLHSRPGAQLSAALGSGRPVYAFGMPGSALLDYAERIRFASQRLGARDFVVVMEAGDVRQSLCGSGSGHGPCLDRETFMPRTVTVPPPSRLKRLVSHSALAQYAVGQLKLEPQRMVSRWLSAQGGPAEGDLRSAVQVDSDVARARRVAMVQAVSDAFFGRIAPHAKGRLVLVLDGRRSKSELQRGTGPVDPIIAERDLFMELAKARGATIVDAEDLYRAHWHRTDLRLDVGPYDAHFNPLGVRLLMQAAAVALR